MTPPAGSCSSWQCQTWSAAQVILAIDPLFSILLGLAVDKSETKLGPLGWTGGGILIFACLVASRYARAH